MDTFKSFESKLYSVNEGCFDDIALEVFQYQSEFNPLYNTFIRALGVQVNTIDTIHKIPYMPISFFKGQSIQTGNWVPETFFSSSGTTGMIASNHAVRDLDFYCRHSRACFEYFFGPVKDYHILALLPSYLERSGSSLITMVDYFMQLGEPPYKAYYLKNHDKLLQDIDALRKIKKKIIIWGVSYALLDLAEKGEVDLGDCLVFETGGMKGRRREITRQELHSLLKTQFNVPQIYSEYGMTELFSQAYTRGTTRFNTPPWLKVVGRDLSDPLTKGLLQETSGINVADLANWNTISFIETEDMGKVFEDGSFEVLGRMDNSDVRGCNLMVQ